MLLFYSFALALVLVVGAPYWLFRMVTSGKYREGLSERLGIVPRRLLGSEGQPVIWVHAVSVGELLAVAR
ncbi:MAG TPA: glycosyltransferase N-terminal domain-containing protein, partial [Pseudacidobacterium sp.]|nr:glycosyltransferase N-terminal domain-containing protein [Pseudacidobacterium sp.]